jgi:PDZ domain-containing protein
MRITPGTLALLGATLLAGVVVLSFSLTSGDFLYVPNEAQPVADNVSIEGKKDPSDARGGIYTVDVTVREARWAERLLPFLRPDGASIVPGDAVTARGESFEERRAKSRAEMARSEQVASAVALDAAGLDVTAKPRGVLVTSVAPDVPAATQLEEGDVILEAAGRETLTPGALRAAVGTVEPGEPVSLRLRRAGSLVERTVKTVAAPGEPERPIIGIGVSQDAKIELPVEVEISLGDVGGPSAGLPFALQVLQELGTDVDRGYRVAATGEIELDGTVAPVGGLKQKTLGVKASGVDVFLVPAGENAEVARRFAGNLRVIPVESFQQALRVLRTLPAK